MPSFEELKLDNQLYPLIERLGYETPTPVQAEAIPKVLEGYDVIAAASTGTGKTAAFLFPVLSNLPKGKRGYRPPRVLVLTPTRELAEQISGLAFKTSKALGLYSTVVYGGTPYSNQIRDIKGGCDVLIATPGRLNDLIGRGVVDLGSIEVLVLDEADRMLDMGFLPDIKKIVELIPDERQTLLFSATIDKSIQKNFAELLNEPEIIQIAQKGETSKIVDQYIYPVSIKDKPELLKCLLDEKGHDKVIVFARTKARAEDVAKMLNEAGFTSECIHSNKTQGQRRSALRNFKNGKAGIIVATDVLARGIDIPLVDYVVNYDLPDMAEDYIHRIGRTGRAGNDGFAVSFVTNKALKELKAIESLIGKDIPIMRLDSFDADLSQLNVSGRKKKTDEHSKTRAKNFKKNRKKSEAAYNYTGYGDLRKGKKKRKDMRVEDAAEEVLTTRGDKKPQQRRRARRPGDLSGNRRDRIADTANRSDKGTSKRSSKSSSASKKQDTRDAKKRAAHKAKYSRKPPKSKR